MVIGQTIARINSAYASLFFSNHITQITGIDRAQEARKEVYELHGPIHQAVEGFANHSIGQHFDQRPAQWDLK
jgi:hypothetical protein